MRSPHVCVWMCLVAVVPVVLYHVGLATFSGGFVGVDVFFVISGFLITSMITEDLRRDRFSLRTFYERRIRRIFPALFTVLLATTALSALILLPRDFASYGRSLMATALFGSNIFFWGGSDYFSLPRESYQPDAELQPANPEP